MFHIFMLNTCHLVIHFAWAEGGELGAIQLNLMEAFCEYCQCAVHLKRSGGALSSPVIFIVVRRVISEQESM